jgi:hypothetical protein
MEKQLQHRPSVQYYETTGVPSRTSMACSDSPVSTYFDRQILTLKRQYFVSGKFTTTLSEDIRLLAFILFIWSNF